MSFALAVCFISYTVSMSDLFAGRRVANRYSSVEASVLVSSADSSSSCATLTRTTDMAGASTAGYMGRGDTGHLA